MIKLFNMDLHIAVIGDFKNIMQHLFNDDKISITEWCISSHSFAFNKQPQTVHFVNQYTWWNINTELIHQFATHYHDFLSTFDGFIVTHSPIFCRLFESFNKPIIMINSCRYDQPFCFTNNKVEREKLNECLLRLHNRKLLIAVSNNKGEQEYLQLGTTIKSEYIPSLCLYNQKYNISSNEIMTDANNKLPSRIQPVKCKPSTRFTWEDYYKTKAFIQIPYECSTMSIFEQYSSNIPMIFPTKSFYKQLVIEKYTVMNNYNEIYWKKNTVPIELEDTMSLDWWLERSDYYNNDVMKYCYYFDSWDELQVLIDTFTDTYKNEREEFIKERTRTVMEKWKSIMIDTFPCLNNIIF